METTSANRASDSPSGYRSRPSPVTLSPSSKLSSIRLRIRWHLRLWNALMTLRYSASRPPCRQGLCRLFLLQLFRLICLTRPNRSCAHTRALTRSEEAAIWLILSHIHFSLSLHIHLNPIIDLNELYGHLLVCKGFYSGLTC